MSAGVLPRRAAVIVFLAFAFAYFLSALLRAVTATLAPTLSQEFTLHASDLGLLAGGYFLGFSATQLPLGTWLSPAAWCSPWPRGSRACWPGACFAARASAPA